MKTIGQVSEQTIVYNGYENRVQNAKIHNDYAALFFTISQREKTEKT